MERKQVSRLGDLNPSGCAIIIPLTGHNLSSVLHQAEQVSDTADAVEWRLDHLTEMSGPVFDLSEGLRVAGVQVGLAISRVREAAQVPVIATLRTVSEGGKAHIVSAQYQKVVTILSAAAEWVDIEFPAETVLSEGGSTTQITQLVQQVQQNGARTIGSYHNFNATPAADFLVKTLENMHDSGFDIAKVAVRANSPQDLLTLWEATWKVHSENQSEKELLTVSMGSLGIPSRLLGQAFGNCATFATHGTATSAPGQIAVGPIQMVQKILADQS